MFARHASSTSTTSLQTELPIEHIVSTTLPDQRPAAEPEDLEAWAMGEVVNRIRQACESSQLKVTTSTVGVSLSPTSLTRCALGQPKKDTCSLSAVTSTGVEGVLDGSERFEINLEGSGHGPRWKRMRGEEGAANGSGSITLELAPCADGDEMHAPSVTPGLRKFWELLLADVQRTNRRWRRALQRA